jgi:Zn-dependent protease
VGTLNGLTLGRVFETEVRAHWTWVLILAFIAVVFGIDLSDGTAASWPPVVAWGSSIATAALVFASVTAHELAHVRVARGSGMRLPVVVVQLLGGPYVMEVRPKTAGEELRIAIAGSALSLLLACTFGAVAGFLILGPFDADHAPEWLQAFGFVTFTASAFNLLLCVINLLPGYPLDGARVLHALVWQRTGQEAAATTAAIRVGRYLGISLIATGMLMLLLVDGLAGLSLVIAGWLVMGSSRILDRRNVLQSLLSGLLVSDAEDADPARVPPQLTLDVFAGEYLGERMGAAALVERGTELLGLIGTAQIRRIPRRSWTKTRTEDAMVSIANVPTLAADSDLWSALEVLERSGLDALLVSAAGAEGTGSALMSRRSAAQLVHQKAEERQRELIAQGRAKKGRGFGR